MPTQQVDSSVGHQPAVVRPLAFGPVGFFLRELAREHAASLIFLTKKSFANACEFFAWVRGAIGSEAWNA